MRLPLRNSRGVCRNAWLRHLRAMVGCMVAASFGCALAAEAPLKFGVLPYVTPKRLVANFSAMRDLVRDASGTPVELLTGPDYPTFHARTLSGEYDFVLTAPHLARVAELRAGYRAMVMSRYRIVGVLVVPSGSAIRRMEQLRGKVIAVASPESLIHHLVVRYLKNNGLEPGRDVTLRVFDTNQNSLSAPLRGDADVGATGHALWETEAPRSQLRVIAETARAPGFVLLAHPRVPQRTIGAVRAAALAFHETATGARYFAATRMEAWIPVDPVMMQSLDTYLPSH